MPLYEYECDACGHRFELIRKFSDPPVTTCPNCGAEQVRKLVSSPAFQFKGSGWYVTDYARKSEDASGSSTASKAAGESKAESKTDKTETKTESSSTDTKAETAKAGGTTTDKPAAPASSATKDK